MTPWPVYVSVPPPFRTFLILCKGTDTVASISSSAWGSSSRSSDPLYHIRQSSSDDILATLPSESARVLIPANGITLTLPATPNVPIITSLSPSGFIELDEQYRIFSSSRSEALRCSLPNLHGFLLYFLSDLHTCIRKFAHWAKDDLVKIADMHPINPPSSSGRRYTSAQYKRALLNHVCTQALVWCFTPLARRHPLATSAR